MIMKKVKFISAIALSVIMFLTPVYTAYAAEVNECESIDSNNESESIEISEVSDSASADIAVDSKDIIVNDTENDTVNEVAELWTESVDDTAGSGLEGNLQEIGEQRNLAVGNGGGELLSTTAGGNSSYKGTIGEDLTLILRGLNDTNQAASFNAINTYISQILENGTSVTLTNSSYVDAEKFSVFTEGYDSNHCWAATSANILWNTGYAQQAINPLTNDFLKSEDEVLTYFSESFVDAAGAPDDGNEWFITGNYSGSTTRKNDNPGGLLTSVDNFSQLSTLTYILNDYTKLSVLENIGLQGMGVQVRWLTGNTLSENAHWFTIVGTIINEAVTEISERFKAIIIADSDSNPVYNEEIDLNNFTMDAKLAAKSSQPNRYTVHRITYNSAMGAWTIDGYSEGQTTVITYLYSLLENQKTDDGETTVVVSEDTNEIFIVDTGNSSTSNDTNIAMTADYFYSLTSEQLSQPESQIKLYNYMIDNNVSVFFPNKGNVSDESDYEIYTTSHQTFIYGVFVDGVQIPFNEYTIVGSSSGLTKIVIKKSYLNQLLKGQHRVKINMQGRELPVEYELKICP